MEICDTIKYMSQFEDYVFEKFKNCILSWDKSLVDDIYCLEIFKGDHAYCQSGFALTYNTESHLSERMKAVGEDAKWDFAEWTCAYPTGAPEDAEEVALWEKWCKENAIPTNEKETEYCGEHIYEAAPLYTTCRILAENLAQRLHKEGVILKVFGVHLPVYITDNDGFFDRPSILSANPPEAVKEFEQVSRDWKMPEWAK